MSELAFKSTVAELRSTAAATAAFVVAAGSLAILAGTLFFQYVLLIAPCPLCLEQRKFHYVVVALAVATGVAALKRAPRRLVIGALAVIGVVLLAGAAVAIYHSGVEWKLWAGPADCSGPITSFGKAGGSLLEQIEKTSVVRCDEASWRFLGLSLAGYNAIASLALAALALAAAVKERTRA